MMRIDATGTGTGGKKTRVARALRRACIVHAAVLAMLGVAFGGWMAVPPRGSGSGTVEVLRAAAPDAIPQPRTYTTRDGSTLQYRLYGKHADLLLLLVHGSTTDGRSLHLLASRLASTGAATVAVPDLRGHGERPARRGDVDHVGQLEDDLADLLAHLRVALPATRVVLGGHSLGGGLVIRFAGGARGSSVDAYLLLAPFLHHSAPTARPQGGGWAVPHVGRFAVLSILNALGVHTFDGATVIAFDVPSDRLDHHTTSTYSYRMQTSFAPRDYRTDITSMSQPLLLVVGREDETLLPEAFEVAVRPHHPTAEIVVVDGATHVGIVTDATAADLVHSWLTHGFKLR